MCKTKEKMGKCQLSLKLKTSKKEGCLLKATPKNNWYMDQV